MYNDLENQYSRTIICWKSDTLSPVLFVRILNSWWRLSMWYKLFIFVQPSFGHRNDIEIFLKQFKMNELNYSTEKYCNPLWTLFFWYKMLTSVSIVLNKSWGKETLVLLLIKKKNKIRVCPTIKQDIKSDSFLFSKAEF